MINEKDLQNIVKNILAEMSTVTYDAKEDSAAPQSPVHTSDKAVAKAAPDGELCVEVPDITAIELQKTLFVDNPKDKDEYLDLKSHNPARLGVGRSGPRQKTITLLRMRADHAAAMDSVQNPVEAEIIKELGFFEVKSSAPNKAEYLMDPELGKVFDEETKAEIKANCKQKPQVQIIVSDGLSASSVDRNIKDILPSLEQGLKGNGLSVGTNIFVELGRVGIMDAVSELLEPEVTILFVGERPGMLTNESLSCYMAYKCYPGMPENGRTCVSNIYKDGTPAAEAGAHIADLAKMMIDRKASGLELQL